jgi:hypothetical protein
VNSRVLTSRNKREGEYGGKRRFKRQTLCPRAQHWRTGKDNGLSLKEWSRL